MRDRGLLVEFSEAALEQARTLQVAADGGSGRQGAGIRDLRALLWSSIDNDELPRSRSADRGRDAAGDVVRVRVAVADVDALVTLGSPLDEHARHNTTSVYTAAAIFPMLPERLSTDLTSLNPDVDRLAVVVEMDVAADGAVVQRRTSTGPGSTITPSSPTTAWRRGWMATRSHASGAGGCGRTGRQPPAAGPSGPAPATATPAARSAESRDDPRAAGVRRRRPPRSRRGPEEPCHRADRGLHDRRQRRDGAVPRRRSAFR